MWIWLPCWCSLHSQKSRLYSQPLPSLPVFNLQLSSLSSDPLHIEISLPMPQIILLLNQIAFDSTFLLTWLSTIISHSWPFPLPGIYSSVGFFSTIISYHLPGHFFWFLLCPFYNVWITWLQWTFLSTQSGHRGWIRDSTWPKSSEIEPRSFFPRTAEAVKEKLHSFYCDFWWREWC